MGIVWTSSSVVKRILSGFVGEREGVIPAGSRGLSRDGHEGGGSLGCKSFRNRECGKGGKGVRVGVGHDTHRLVQGRKLILGGVLIAHELGLDGHSDADVLLHALADALLGAAGLGDIGELYPDNAPENKDLDSSVLLAAVVQKVRDAGYRVGNCDLIVHAERPKLLPFKPVIRESVARLLGVELQQVNVKAKTGERVGPVGRQEAITAEAIVLLLDGASPAPG